MSARSPAHMGSGTVAAPRRPVSKETYRGEDLCRTSARAGAYDAFALPSVMSGRRVTREQQRKELLAPTPQVPPARPASSMADPLAAALAPPPEAPAPRPEPVQPPAVVTRLRRPVEPLTPGRSASLSAYRPRDGSGPHQVLRHLQQHGGHLFYNEICARFDVAQHSLTAIFKPALVRGALVRLQIGDRRALALPGYVPPEEPAAAVTASPARPAGRPSREDEALRLLEDRRVHLRAWQAHVDALQWRALTLRVLAALPPNPDEAPRLAGSPLPFTTTRSTHVR